jgi:hypothetical protein
MILHFSTSHVPLQRGSSEVNSFFSIHHLLHLHLHCHSQLHYLYSAGTPVQEMGSSLYPSRVNYPDYP